MKNANIETGILSPNAITVLERRYLSSGETPRQRFQTVCEAVAQAEPHNRDIWVSRFFHELLWPLKFLPNSPTLVNAGKPGKGCLSACFVVSPEDSMESILQVAKEWGMIEKHGGGIGASFSRLRPKGDSISTTHGKALGVVSTMQIYSTVADQITQGSFRMGAHMAQLSISHPEVRDFIHCKDGDNTLQNFNISVQLTDEFMEDVMRHERWPLFNPRDGALVVMVQTDELWREICEAAWKTGDPGVVFIDRVWETQPNPQLGRIEGANPCSEEFLENYGSCNLGSIDLSKHLTPARTDFDWAALSETVWLAVRFLDDVVEINTFPPEVPQLKEMNQKTRRIGLGVMGWADALVMLGISYDTKEAVTLAKEVSKFITDRAWEASAHLAEEKGAFPEWENSALKERLPWPVRNSNVTTIAPTGTISLIAGCSSGIEPLYALAWRRKALWDQAGAQATLVECPAPVREALLARVDEEFLDGALAQLMNHPAEALARFGLDPALYRTAMEISPEWHIRHQAAWQSHVTNGVSKTINLPNSATVEDVSNAFLMAYQSGCKAVTVYRDGSKRQQVLETGNAGPAEEVKPRSRPRSMVGVTHRIGTAHGNLYVTINEDTNGEPFEVFTVLGKAGGCSAAMMEGLSRMISLALRSGIQPGQIMEQLRGISCCPSFDNGRQVKSPVDAIAIAMETVPEYGEETAVMAEANPLDGLRCFDCNGLVIREEGCLTCHECGWTRCG